VRSGSRRLEDPEAVPAVARPRAAHGARRLDELTHRGNLGSTRHGFLRLTPAYSVHLVRDLLEESKTAGSVLDPFCGTGTTVLACAEAGLSCTTIDLNPFLVWFARTKVARYSVADVDAARHLVTTMTHAARERRGASVVPTIHRIDRWWDSGVLGALGRAHAVARSASRDAPRKAADLASVAFCRAVIECANVSFGHQSMSFRKNDGTTPRRGSASDVATALERAVGVIADAVLSPLPNARARVLSGDSRAVDRVVGRSRFTTVLTSPPYPNRMSYVRELRPYMYWLGYLAERRDAGELDWSAIGGTWGAATSRLGAWRPDPGVSVPFRGFDKLVRRISRHEPILGRYVERYFEDMTRHAESLARVVEPGASLKYVVGNSKFYDVLVPVQEIFAALFEHAGFVRPRIRVLRKRTSKRELYEYLVEADAPRSGG